MFGEREADRLSQMWRRPADDSLQGYPRNRDAPLILLGTQGRIEDDVAIRTFWTRCGVNPEGVLLRIVHVLTLPVTVPLNVYLPQAEEKSAHILRRAQVVARTTGATVQTAVLRGRSVAEALVEDARRTSATAIVVRLRSRETLGAHLLLSRTVRGLLTNAPCPVIIVHLPHVRVDAQKKKTVSITNREHRQAHVIHRSS